MSCSTSARSAALCSFLATSAGDGRGSAVTRARTASTTSAVKQGPTGVRAPRRGRCGALRAVETCGVRHRLAPKASQPAGHASEEHGVFRRRCRSMPRKRQGFWGHRSAIWSLLADAAIDRWRHRVGSAATARTNAPARRAMPGVAERHRQLSAATATPTSCSELSYCRRRTASFATYAIR